MLAENISNWKVYLKHQETDLKYQSADKKRCCHANRAVISLITTPAPYVWLQWTALQSLYFLTISFQTFFENGQQVEGQINLACLCICILSKRMNILAAKNEIARCKVVLLSIIICLFQKAHYLYHVPDVSDLLTDKQKHYF